jgi:hypothetical protein
MHGRLVGKGSVNLEKLGRWVENWLRGYANDLPLRTYTVSCAEAQNLRYSLPQ